MMSHYYRIVHDLFSSFLRAPLIPLLFVAMNLHCDGVSVKHLAHGICFVEPA